MKTILLFVFLAVGFGGCDRYIRHSLAIEPPPNTQSIGKELEDAFLRLDKHVIRDGFARVVVPEITRRSNLEHGREILAWYDSDRAIAPSRGSWMFFYFFREIQTGKLVAEFHQFPHLSERTEFVNAQKTVEEIFGENGFRLVE